MTVKWRIRRKEFSLEKFEMLAAMLNIKPAGCVVNEFKSCPPVGWPWVICDGQVLDLACENYTHIHEYKELTIEEIINVHFNAEENKTP